MTPMMQQYLEAKAQYPDALLLFRMGDFYEMFYEDAVTASEVLDLTLTSRSRKNEDRIPMAGVPHHAVDSYIARLLEAGFKVAVCDQLEDATKAKGIVRRGIVRVITPGLVLEETTLDAAVPNYLAAVVEVRRRKLDVYGLAYLDVSTGEFRGTEIFDRSDLLSELGRIGAREVVLPEALAPQLRPSIEQTGNAICSTLPKGEWNLRRVVKLARDTEPLYDADIPTTYFLEPHEIGELVVGLDSSGFQTPEVVKRAAAGILT